jgi:hypothetical protein
MVYRKVKGWISKVDQDHIDRLIHFYNKHGFTVIMCPNFQKSDGIKIGDLYWIGGNKEGWRAV